jgi:hypothetical protein
MYFELNTSFNKKKCQIPQNSMFNALFLLSDGRFFASTEDSDNHSRYDSVFLIGRYRNQEDTLILYAIKNNLFQGWKMKTSKKEALIKKNFRDVRFKIDTCSNEKIMLTSIVRRHKWYGMRPDLKKEKEYLVKIHQDSSVMNHLNGSR